MCRKRRYDTELDAMIKLSSIQAKRNDQRRPKTERTVYQCTTPKCKGAWHLTSQDGISESTT